MLKKSLIIFIMLVLSSSCSKDKSDTQEAPAVPVLATKPAIKDIPVYLESIGILQASNYMEIVPQANGNLIEILAEEGDWVKEGTPLFKIDSRPYAVRAKQAQAKWSADKVSKMTAKKKLERYQTLAEKDLVAQVEWDEIQAQALLAEANLKADEAEVEAAQLELSYCTVTSPIEGRVGKIDVSRGIYVNAGSAPLTSVSDMDPLLLEFTVTEKEFREFPKEHPEITIQALASSEMSHKGQVYFLDNHFDPQTGLLIIRAMVDNPETKLRPGQSVKVQVPVSIQTNAKLIPQKAIKYNQQGPYIYVVQNDNTVGFRQIILGKEQGLEVVVKEGLDADEQVITDGHLRLSPGLKVEVKS